MPTSDFEHFAGRGFSFYPPILSVEHNEWTYVEGSWSEIRVKNTGSDFDLWIPRRYIGEVSQVEDPVMIIGLNQELIYEGGMVIPHRRRVVEMPRTTNVPLPSVTVKATSPPPSVFRTDSSTEKNIGMLIVGVLAVAIIGTFLTVMLTRDKNTGGRISFEPVLQVVLDLTAEDDYYSVKRKLGEPAGDRWRAATGEMQYRALDYPELGITVLLMGNDREHIRYIGAKGTGWKNVHVVKHPGGGDTASILRSLNEF
jgi:hypothetical protein